MGLVYIITCSKTNKVYIGQTTDPLRIRWNGHKSSARYNKDYLNGDKEALHNKRGMCSKLYRAMNDHGIENFRMDILEDGIETPIIDGKVNRKLLDKVEEQYITEFDSVANGYNLKSGGDSSNHSDETKALLKIKNAEHMQTTFTQFRKHEILDDLPIHCIYIKKPNTNGIAINKHPLCDHKEFTVRKYKSMDNAKAALKEYLANLEATGIPKPKQVKKDPTLPKGVNKIKKCYFVDKTVKGKTYRQAFSELTDDENKQAAIAYLNSLLH